MKNPTSARISDMTKKQIAELSAKTGMNQTEVITVSVNEFSNKMEAKMKTKDNLSQAHYDIIDWVGDSEFINTLTEQQAQDMLRWLEENDISVEREVDIEKLRDYCEERGF